MPADPRTPVLVGVGAVQQRREDAALALEPVELMIQALESAAADAGNRELLARADSIRAPHGIWDYADPCRLVAERFGAAAARTEVAELGVLQTTLFGRAAADIAAGRSDVVLITGGEAKYRALRAQIAGREAPLTKQYEVAPDTLLAPDTDIVSQAEIQAGIFMPVSQYAMIENAFRAARGQSLEAHQREVAELWASMSRVAVDNPAAWNRSAVGAEKILAGDGGNRMLAFPYRKLHNSQWNVDQAAGLILCSAATARSMGIAEGKWVFPHCVADANYMLPLTQRRVLDRCAGFRAAGLQVSRRIGRELGELEHRELYSCFPIAVRVQMRELGVGDERPITVTGGMAFAGGPLNNFVLQALVRMAEVLRGDPGSAGLVTAVSGMLTKQGVSVWSTEPPVGGFHFDDVSEEAKRGNDPVEVVSFATGSGTIATYTVFYEDDRPKRSILLCDLDDGRRALVDHRDAGMAESMTREEFCGRSIKLGDSGRVEIV